MRVVAATLLFFLCVCTALSAEKLWIIPNPSYSRDLAMGSSTLALSYAPQSQSINPAGLTLWPTAGSVRLTGIVNLAGSWSLAHYDSRDRKTFQQLTDGMRLLIGSVGGQYRALAMMLLLSQPVMMRDDHSRYQGFLTSGSTLKLHANSLHASLALHRRVSVGGRLDRYYRGDDPEGESYSYGVIFRPRGIRLGVQYQRFPASGVREWHPLDRRSDAATTAGLSTTFRSVTFTGQVMNLTNPDAAAFLEPHVGIEWRPSRMIAFRGGGLQFSRSRRWAATAGFGVGDANWIRPRAARLLMPDEVLQCAFAWQYEDRRPELFIGSLTLMVRI